MPLNILTSNTILYCQHYDECLKFYKDLLGLEITLASDWLVEFRLTDSARVSLADQARTAIKSAQGQGITLTWEVADIEKTHMDLKIKGAEPSDIITHSWNARLFRFYDPERNRLEIWTNRSQT